MGYYSRLSGRIKIDPPLSWSEIVNTGFDPDTARAGLMAVMIDVDVTVADADDGILTTKRGIAIVPTQETDGKFYDWELKMVALCENPVFANRILTGHIIRAGEDRGDVQRIDGRGNSETVRMTWPDGSSVEL